MQLHTYANPCGFLVGINCWSRYEDMKHDGPAAMIRLNKAQWFDYHFESMKRATANLPERSIQKGS